jgi:uncharacterized protein YjbI with pentapeptide repeats
VSLSGAILAFANLRGTDLSGVNLSGASLYEAIMNLAPRLPYVALDSKTIFGDIDW